jgi:hypothetical protein
LGFQNAKVLFGKITPAEDAQKSIKIDLFFIYFLGIFSKNFEKWGKNQKFKKTY